MNTSEFQSLCVTNRVSALIAALPTLQEVEITLLVIQNQPVKLHHLTSSVPVLAICVTQKKLHSLPPIHNTIFLVPATNQILSQA